MKDYNILDEKLGSGPSPTLAIEGEAHEKLKRNLHLALDLHGDIMEGAQVAENASDRRLMAEVATATVKAALATDRTALKARRDNTLERLVLRVLFHRKRLGYDMAPRDLEELKNAPRVELEAALSPRWMAEYDQMEF